MFIFFFVVELFLNLYIFCCIIKVNMFICGWVYVFFNSGFVINKDNSNNFLIGL